MKKTTSGKPLLDMEQMRKALGADEVIPLKGETPSERAAEALALYKKRQRDIRKKPA